MAGPVILPEHSAQTVISNRATGSAAGAGAGPGARGTCGAGDHASASARAPQPGLPQAPSLGPRTAHTSAARTPRRHLGCSAVGPRPPTPTPRGGRVGLTLPLVPRPVAAGTAPPRGARAGPGPRGRCFRTASVERPARHLEGLGARHPSRLPPAGLHQRGPKGGGVTHFLDVPETFSSL